MRLTADAAQTHIATATVFLSPQLLQIRVFVRVASCLKIVATKHCRKNCRKNRVKFIKGGEEIDLRGGARRLARDEEVS